MQKIRIGNQTAYSASTPLEPFQYAIKNEFDAFEWFPDKKEDGSGWDIKDIDSDTRKLINTLAREHDIRLSVHAPWHANPLIEGDRESILESIYFAHEIGADLLNIHFYADKGVEKFLQSLIPVLEHVRHYGLTLSLENSALSSPDNFNELFYMLQSFKAVPDGNIGMCLDIGHANLHETCRNDYLKYVGMIEPYVPVVHVHMHENYGESDSHLPMFSGPAGKDDAGIKKLIDWLKGRNFSGSIILEQWPEPLSLLNMARKRLLQLLD